MTKYSVYIDLDSFTYAVEAQDEETAKALAVKEMEAWLAKYSADLGIADVIVDEDPLLEDSDIEISE